MLVGKGLAMARNIICLIACLVLLSTPAPAAKDCETGYTEDIFHMIGDVVMAPCELLAACMGLVGEMIPVGPRYEIVYVTEEIIEEEVIEAPPQAPVAKEEPAPEPVKEPSAAPTAPAPAQPRPQPQEEIIVPSPPRPAPPVAPEPQAPKTPEIKEKPPVKPKPCVPRIKPPCGPAYPYPKGGEYWFLFQ
jgi:hypothetical protein